MANIVQAIILAIWYALLKKRAGVFFAPTSESQHDKLQDISAESSVESALESLVHVTAIYSLCVFSIIHL